MNIGLLIKQSGFSKSCDGTDSYVGDYEDFERLTKAIRAEARAEHEKQEPVAWWNGKETAWFEHELCGWQAPDGCTIPLYAAPVQPVKQEPVAVISESAIGLVKLHSNGACLPFGTQLYAAPVSAEAIRAGALEEAAKVCEEGTALTYFQNTDCYNYAHNRAKAIRSLK